MRTPSWRLFTAVATTALAGVLVSPAAAHADATIDGGGIVQDTIVVGDGTALTSTTPHNLFYGDCELFTGSTLRIYPPVNGYSYVRWDGRTLTRHTNHADTWHNYFSIRDATGQILRTVGPADSKSMRDINLIYTSARNLQVPMLPSTYQRISHIVWTGVC